MDLGQPVREWEVVPDEDPVKRRPQPDQEPVPEREREETPA